MLFNVVMLSIVSACSHVHPFFFQLLYDTSLINRNVFFCVSEFLRFKNSLKFFMFLLISLISRYESCSLIIFSILKNTSITASA